MAEWQSQPYALVFPGQGAQFVGMGAALIEASPAAAQTVREADEILGVSLSELMANGPAEELEDTYNAQPAILTISVAALRAVESALGDRLHPAMVAGHSLGEFSALVAAGVLDFPDALRLVRERGRIMKAAGEISPGAMAAVLGLDDEVLAEVCREASNDGGEVVVANRNCPGQTVISGDVGALERASELAKERGAKRVARLGVSIASHSPLMADAAAEFGRHVAELTLADPQVPGRGQRFRAADDGPGRGRGRDLGADGRAGRLDRERPDDAGGRDSHLHRARAGRGHRRSDQADRPRGGGSEHCRLGLGLPSTAK